MKKVQLFTASLFLALLLCISPQITYAEASVQSASFDFPYDGTIGDTIDFSAHINILLPDSLFNNPITINIYIANETDTIGFCEGSAEIQEPGILMYEMTCQIPDTLDLGEHQLIIIISTPFGDFIFDGGHSMTINGDHDINGDNSLDISDITYLVAFMFDGGEAPLPGLSNADCNCDNGNDVSDLMTMVDFMFRGGTLPCHSPL